MEGKTIRRVYTVVFMDVIHYHVCNEGWIVKRGAYITIGISMEGYKNVVGMYVG